MKILLTRPINDSVSTSNLLRKFPIKPVILPFLEIKKNNYREFKLAKDNILVFTSKNAATFFKFKKEMKGILILSVGTETKKILQKKGFENIINVDGDLQKLLIVIKKYLNKTKKVYHLTSKTQNVELKKFFQDFDCEYYAIKCYTSKMINVDKKKLISFMKEKKNNIISLYSTLSAKSFVKQIIENDLEALCKNKNFIVISEKVKEELKKLGKLSIFIAKSPKQKRMIDLIRKITLMEEKIG